MNGKKAFRLLVPSFSRRILIFVLFVFSVLSVQKISACMCYGPSDSIKNYFDSSDSVFSGEIVSLKKEKAKVAVDTVWKGDTEAGVYIVDPYFGSSCGGQPKKGTKYVFFVFVTNDYSVIPEFKDVKSPVRRDNLQVFFTQPCWFSSPMDSFVKTVEEYDKEKFWRTAVGKTPTRK